MVTAETQGKKAPRPATAAPAIDSQSGAADRAATTGAASGALVGDKGFFGHGCVSFALVGAILGID
jgi:hypothetical protein